MPKTFLFEALRATSQYTPRVEKSINQVTLLGRVGAEPQKRGSEEHPVVVFSLATHTNSRLTSGEVQQRTEWHRISVFKPLLRDAVYQYMGKGQRVFVQGRLMYGDIVDANGVQRSTTTIVADDVIFLSKSSAAAEPEVESA
ncbi:unnamed protein product [Darwinula stevensoni]|uniref:Single-stranded DNA-binding protein n=1 Tax=Darwinula stevensoni TaxID=69355 RepID=A0A7R9A7G8_9CRUS|nr:unnamed protein product [Darwinula stevensoni]CAG0891771.1 unnamed protein product [Darwinula stevensoni]